MGLLRRQLTGKALTGEANQPPPAGPWVEYPALWEFLTFARWDGNGDAREPGTLMIFADAGRLKVMLNDKDAGMVAFAVVSAAEDVLRVCDAMVLEAATDWRAAKKFTGPRKP